MTIPANKKIMIFGCPMDCDEKYDSIQEKHNIMRTSSTFSDPLDGVMRFLELEESSGRANEISWENLGSLPVPGWLRPLPGSGDHSKISTENFISFIDNDGCRQIADDAGSFVKDQILPHIPLMIGIDHSLTGGVFCALNDHYGKGNVSLIVIDSHTDAVPMSSLAGAIQYDVETNPESVHDADDAFIYNRPDSYNASSFLHTLIKEEQLNPKNMYILGVSDFPEKKALKIKDSRIKKYTNAYLGLRRKGAKIITKKECKLNPGKIKAALSKISTEFVYLSVDMDIGANNALDGVRFRNWTGLDENKIYKLVDIIEQVLTGVTAPKLIGMDICEIDPRRAGALKPGGKDRTYEIAAGLVKKILFNN